MVYVVQQPKNNPGKPVYDISPCLQFGDPEFIFKSWEQPGGDPHIAHTRAQGVVSRFRPEHDFVLWAGGDPFALALVSAMLIERFSHYNFLRWERTKAAVQPGHYVSVTVKG